MMINEIAQHIHNNSVASLATDLFVGYLPDTPADCISVRETGGTEPDQELPFKEPMFQVYIRSTTYSAGRDKLSTIRDLFHAKRMTTLVNGGTFFEYIYAASEGGHLGRDESGRDTFSINFRARTR